MRRRCLETHDGFMHLVAYTILLRESPSGKFRFLITSLFSKLPLTRKIKDRNQLLHLAILNSEVKTLYEDSDEVFELLLLGTKMMILTKEYAEGHSIQIGALGNWMYTLR